MGNAMFFCMLQPASAVRVIRSDGEVLEFDHPVIAKQLMKVYPGHLVVHCSQVNRSKGLGQRSKVSMMRAEDTLSPGQTYCLLRVPTQSGKGLLPKAPSFKASTDKTRTSSTLRGMMFGQSKDGRVCDVEQQQQYVLQYTAPVAAAPSLPGGHWRPQLDAIIESPLNSMVPSRGNSFAMSPLARQAGYVPMSSPLRTVAQE